MSVEVDSDVCNRVGLGSSDTRSQRHTLANLLIAALPLITLWQMQSSRGSPTPLQQVWARLNSSRCSLKTSVIVQGLSIRRSCFAWLVSTLKCHPSDYNSLVSRFLCLTVWGNMNQPVSAVLPRAGQLFYPDWKFNSGTCLSDGNQPPYMKINNPDGYLHESLEECCEAWYGVS